MYYKTCRVVGRLILHFCSCENGLVCKVWVCSDLCCRNSNVRFCLCPDILPYCFARFSVRRDRNLFFVGFQRQVFECCFTKSGFSSIVLVLMSILGWFLSLIVVFLKYLGTLDG